MSCDVQTSGTIELYFYGELPLSQRAEIQAHLQTCPECRVVFEDLSEIRAVLAVRPDVATPPGGDWSSFMVRLNERIAADVDAPSRSARVIAMPLRRRVAPFIAAAAVLTLVTISAVLMVRRSSVPDPSRLVTIDSPTAPVVRAMHPVSADPALTAVSDQHFERSKLVVLGLATKDGRQDDWEYERELAGSLLSDTRLYRVAAEERGMQSLAGVMRDLELVLLQASMAEGHDADSLAQLQRLIRRRDLITKMEVVHAGGPR